MLNGDEPATTSLLYLLSTRGTQCNLVFPDAQYTIYFLELVACLLAEECTMQVICAFLDAKRTMQQIFHGHNATCLLLAKREVNNTISFLFLAKWRT